MKIGLIHVIGTLFIVFAWSRVFLRYRDNAISLFGLIFWSLIWTSLLVVLFIPETTEFLAKKLGIGRGVDVVVYSAVVVIFYLIYRIYVKIESLEREITHVVREDALRDLPKKN